MECENVELLLSILLIISEILPFIKNKDSCNGVINTLFCLLKKNDDCISDTSSIASNETIDLAIPVAPPSAPPL